MRASLLIFFLQGMQSPTVLSPLKEGMETSNDEVAFEKLLCAMYHKKYSISGLRELSDMTRLADFYCCLPTASIGEMQNKTVEPLYL